MKVEGLSIALRPRSMAEAADLGVALVRRHAASVWLSFLPVYAAVLALALCTATIAEWLPGLVIFCLKPWLDRSLLFVLSRAVFGQTTRWHDLWEARRSVWGGQLLRTLVLQRLSPWRSFTQPIAQLEGQRGAAARQRREQLLQGHRASALAMQSVFGTIEVALEAALLSLLFWFSAQGGLRGMFNWLMVSDGGLQSFLLSATYALSIALVEPFFVAAGFAMYLNRRVELEAWDIEQEFRHAFST